MHCNALFGEMHQRNTTEFGAIEKIVFNGTIVVLFLYVRTTENTNYTTTFYYYYKIIYIVRYYVSRIVYNIL